MGLKVINFRNHQIETVRFGNKVVGFKVHARDFVSGKGVQNSELLAEFSYFNAAAQFIARRIELRGEVQSIIVAFLCSIYAEGDDF